MIIKQSTARTILVGPVLDSTGAAKTDEVVGSIKVTKNGTVGAANGSATLTHDHTGKYKLALTATDCDTVGVLEISLNSGTNDMPVARLCVIEEAVYDISFAASATGQVPLQAGTGTGQLDFTSGVVKANVTQYGGSAGTFASGRPEVNTTHAAGTAWASGAITAAVIADGAIDRATFAADTGLQTIRSGTAQAGATNSITLDASASATNSTYVGQKVTITGGTGVGQSRIVISYNGTSKIALIAQPNWVTNPDNTSTFAITDVKVDIASVNSDAQSIDNLRTFCEEGTLNGMFISVDVYAWHGDNVSVPTVAGVPNVNVKTWNDLTTVALPLVPTTAGRTLDVSATGEAGIDWANVGSPTTTVGLSGTTIATSQVVASVTGAVGSVTGNVGGSVASVVGLTASNLDATISSRMATYTQPTGFLAATFPATVASTTNITAGTITTVTNLTNLPAITTNWLTAAGLAADAVTEIQAGLSTIDAAGVRSAVGLAAANLDTQLLAIVADTNELQTDWANGGRLDLIIDSRASQTSVDDLPTNAELATALASADDATLAAIAALSFPSAATISTQVGTDLSTAHGAGSWATATGFSTHSAADVWAVGTRTITGGTIGTYTGNTPQTGDAYAVVNSGTYGNAALKALVDILDTVVDAILEDTGTTGVALSAAICNKIADHVRRRTQSNVEASSDGDTLSVGSLYGAIQQSQESAISGTTQTIYKTDGSTSLGTKTVSKTPGDDPIRGVS